MDRRHRCELAWASRLRVQAWRMQPDRLLPPPPHLPPIPLCCSPPPPPLPPLILSLLPPPLPYPSLTTPCVARCPSAPSPPNHCCTHRQARRTSRQRTQLPQSTAGTSNRDEPAYASEQGHTDRRTHMATALEAPFVGHLNLPTPHHDFHLPPPQPQTSHATWHQSFAPSAGSAQEWARMHHDSTTGAVDPRQV